MHIKIDDLSSLATQDLIKDYLAEITTYENMAPSNAFSTANLQMPSVTLFTAWDGDIIMGCGAIKEHSATLGELKSVYTSAQYRGKKVGRHMLAHIIQVAKERGYKNLNLETHPGAAYLPARKLYEKFEFSHCGPFGDYKARPYSVFMSKTITPNDPTH